jgi:hypothetical protein
MKSILQVVLLFILGFCSSCLNQIQERRNQNEIAKLIEEFYNQEFIVPDTLTVLQHGNKEKLLSHAFINSKVKVISILNTDCRNCSISQLMFWDSFRQEFEGRDGLLILVVVLGEDEYIENVLIPELGLTTPVVLDSKKEFLKNAFLSMDKFSTVLIDDENQIVLIGDTGINTELEDLYVSEITKRLDVSY